MDMSKDRKASRLPRTQSGTGGAVLGKRSWIDTEAGSEPLHPTIGVALNTVRGEETHPHPAGRRAWFVYDSYHYRHRQNSYQPDSQQPLPSHRLEGCAP